MTTEQDSYTQPATQRLVDTGDARPTDVRTDVVTEPVIAEPVVAQPVVAQRVVAQPVPVVERVVVPQRAVHTTVATSSQRRIAFDSFIVGLIGLALTIVGLIAATRAGFDGPMDQPVVSVIGFTHTTTLGIIEAVMGILLLISAAATSRSAAVFFGLVLGVGGIVGAVQTDSFRRSLALESGLAWLVVVAAAVVVLVSLLVPRMDTSTARVESV